MMKAFVAMIGGSKTKTFSDDDDDNDDNAAPSSCCDLFTSSLCDASQDPIVSKNYRQHDIYYTLRRDLRECASPRCGGWFATAINTPEGFETRCSSLTGEQKECYIAQIYRHDDDIDVDDKQDLVFQALISSHQNTIVVKGEIVSQDFQEFGHFDVMKLGRGISSWRRIGFPRPSLSKDVMYTIRDNGVRCITTPCFSTGVSIVNNCGSNSSFSQTSTIVSSVDMSHVFGATSSDKEEASMLIGSTFLLIEGQFIDDDGINSDTFGKELKASAFHLPI
jgi:hypothetical protein